MSRSAAWCTECGRHQVDAAWQLCPVCLDEATRKVIAALPLEPRDGNCPPDDTPLDTTGCTV
jgi:hypothetical protein